MALSSTDSRIDCTSLTWQAATGGLACEPKSKSPIAVVASALCRHRPPHLCAVVQQRHVNRHDLSHQSNVSANSKSANRTFPTSEKGGERTW